MKSIKILSMFTIAILFGGAAYAAAAEKTSTVKEGKALYLGEKYKCHTCHGQNGEGGTGPTFKGVGKKYTQSELMGHAAHRCPPTAQCSPKEISALVDYIRTL